MLHQSILNFLKELSIDTKLPKDVAMLNPYRDQNVFSLCEKFYKKFYGDNNPRIAILGINPGRLGGGLTGIPFTDPIKLQSACNIENDLQKRAELSADFIHQVIAAYGGLQKFYSKFYFSSVSPLGFTKDGKNLNYYDIPALENELKPFILQSLRTQLNFGLSRKICFVLGEGKNFQYIKSLNAEYGFFEQLVPLAHPRFVMQYKRKQLTYYIQDYIQKLQSAAL
jgi:hypothetical protein